MSNPVTWTIEGRTPTIQEEILYLLEHYAEPRGLSAEHIAALMGGYRHPDRSRVDRGLSQLLEAEKIERTGPGRGDYAYKYSLFHQKEARRA